MTALRAPSALACPPRQTVQVRATGATSLVYGLDPPGALAPRVLVHVPVTLRSAPPDALAHVCPQWIPIDAVRVI